MKWKDVKKRIESFGVKDDDEIAYIDISSDSWIDFIAEYDSVVKDWHIQ